MDDRTEATPLTAAPHDRSGACEGTRGDRPSTQAAAGLPDHVGYDGASARESSAYFRSQPRRVPAAQGARRSECVLGPAALAEGHAAQPLGAGSLAGLAGKPIDRTSDNESSVGSVLRTRHRSQLAGFRL